MNRRVTVSALSLDFLPRRIPTILLFAVVALVAEYSVAPAADEKPKPVVAAFELTPEWTVFQPPMPKAGGSKPLPKKSKAIVMKDLSLAGPVIGHPFFFGKYKATGSWGLTDGRLVPVGQNAALLLAHAENFELEGFIDASGLGGWFVLLGWNQTYGNGTMIYNFEMKESGSLWMRTEYRGFTAVPESNREMNRYTWRKELPARLTVKDEKLSLLAGEDRVLEDVDLPQYKAGDIIVGTYDTKYGPKPLKIVSLRMRSK